MKNLFYNLTLVVSMLTSVEAATPFAAESLNSESPQCRESLSTDLTYGQKAEERFASNARYQFSKNLRSNYIEKALGAYTSQYGNASFLGGAKLIDKNGLLKKAIQDLSNECADHAPQKVKSFIANIRRTNGEREAHVENLSPALKKKYKDFIMKRVIIGIIEAKRIKLILEDFPWSESERKILKERLQGILEVYPLVKASSRYSYSLHNSIASHFNTATLLRQRNSHPEIDRILFPTKENSLISYRPFNSKAKPINLIQKVYNEILSKNLPVNIQVSFQNTLAASLRISADSIKNLCNMSYCDVSQINTKETASVLNLISEDLKEHNQQKLCSCNLNARTESFNIETIIGTSVVSIAGFALCPFTFGVGCYVGGATSAALVGMSAVNTAEAYDDYNHYTPVLSVLKNLPGLTPEEKKQTLLLAQDSKGRIVIGALNMARGSVAVASGLKVGHRVYTSKALNPK